MIALFSFFNDFLILGLENGYLAVNFCDIQMNLHNYDLKKNSLKKFWRRSEKKIWSLIDLVNWTTRLISIRIIRNLYFPSTCGISEATQHSSQQN